MSASQLIANRFKIDDPEHDLLGRGAAGNVYRATDTQTGELVAVKALNPQVVARDPEILVRFVREGQALRQLNHPNIVRMIEAVQEQGQHYLVVEYVSGGSLADVLAAQGQLSSRRVMQIALEVSDALTRAHHLGIIHRDLKPANVLLAQDGTPRLADFGIAHVASEQRMTQTGVLMGTTDYLSPEVLQGESPDERADIWAFGVMLFEMLSGRLPFEGNNLTARLTAILTQPIPDLAQLAPDVPAAFIDLVYRMLDKDPQRRIPSARLVGAELEAILKGRGPVTPPRVTPAPPVNALQQGLPTQLDKEGLSLAESGRGMATLSLFLFGPFQATLDEHPVTGFDSNKSRALLAYLAVEADRPHSRDELIGLFWADQPDTAARASLRQALANLRRVLGDRDAETAFISNTSDGIQFQRASNYSIDMATFSSLLADCKAHAHRRVEMCTACARRLREAVELYRGDFLAQFLQSGSEAFEEWALVKREHWHHAALEALYHLAEYHGRRGEYDQAQLDAERQLELEPWREEAHRQMMRSLAATGQRSAALAQYEACRRVLADELAAKPSKETTALFEKIRADELAREIRRHNLPTMLTPLLGRERELAEIDRLLEMPACRLVTLIGPGGIGKTHLALQAASEHVGAFTHGVYFVPLDALDTPEYIVTAIATALQLTFSEQPDLRTQLFNSLRDKDLLLVLDNFEHLLEGGTGLITNLLQHALQVTILVTSRERLNINGEWILEVGGLRVPLDNAVDQLEDYSAVRLFVQTAQRVQAGFAVQGTERSCVAHLCQLVDGMPLALELAAAWVRALTCRDIAHEIESGLAILASPRRDSAGRHRSMQVVFEHSWKLLSDEERHVLRALSVFRGGFERKGAEAVASATPPVLAALVDKSFLHLNAAGRYTLHELLRQYAGEKLREAGVMEETRNRHLAFFLELAETAEPELHGGEQAVWLQRLERDHDNIRAALDWGLTAGSTREAGLRLSSALVTFWWGHGYVKEGQSWLEKELAASGDVSTIRRAKALTGLGTLAWLQGEIGRAVTFHQESLTLYQALADQRGSAEALNNLGIQALILRDYEQALPLFQESLQLYRALGDKTGIAKVLNSLGSLARYSNDPEQATARFTESLILFRELDDQRWIAGTLHNLGMVAASQGHFEQVKSFDKESLRLYQQLGEKQFVADPLEALADVCGAQQQPEQAARLLGAAATLREALHTPVSPLDQADYERTLAMVRAQLDAAAFEAAWAAGQAMTIDQAIEYALIDIA